MSPFDTYLQLRDKVDTLCRQIEKAHTDAISCQAGCDSCCLALTLFPVEAYALAKAVAAQPETVRERLRGRGRKVGDNGACPLLEEGHCLLYGDRPIICRTHGLPILLREPEGTRVDFCPLNFVGYDSLTGSSLIDLERLNELLAAINHDFVTRNFGPQALPDRIAIGEALRLPWPPRAAGKTSS
ncbi:YkgJ family cysteine cluster protein [Desulfuromonas sp. AOP6]|uniref:YkgJ family cysteine cluster protein n=1 Tax=Desulfuromonas sp. AOP6 TaxID=1566351 RepID=UPI00127EBA10|nr:YkgJ family cysteine cluster protein [Desulfuromonas sp. AOP6]BCA78622.1 hypothetical protein AOP6_0409 [Desulfuromonas sp. AOP6]